VYGVEGVGRSVVVAVCAPSEDRRASTDSNRSATPSQVQVTHALPGRYTMGQVCTLTGAAGLKDALLHTPQVTILKLLPKSLRMASHKLPVESFPSTQGPDVPLEVLMSRRDSRKMQDLNLLLPKNKTPAYLKVSCPSSCTSSASSSPSCRSPVAATEFPEVTQLDTCPDTLLHRAGVKDEGVVECITAHNLQHPRSDQPHRRKQQQHLREGVADDGHGTVTYATQSSGGLSLGQRRSSHDRGHSTISLVRDAHTRDAHALDAHTGNPNKRDSIKGLKGQSSVDSPLQPPPRETALVEQPKTSVPSYMSELGAQRNFLYSDDNISYVLQGVYMGNIRAAYCEPILCRLNIQCVVDLSNMLPTKVPAEEKSICPCTCPLKTAHHRSRLCINIPDSADIDITQFMAEVNHFMVMARQNQKHILVHSYHGKSRAPAILILYLMTVHRMTLRQAFSLVKASHRPITLNVGFQKTLQDLERRLWSSLPPSLVLHNEAASPNPPQIRRAWN
ncbi:Dual specificity protein phosphatase 1-like, partial [Homarus americanus]